MPDTSHAGNSQATAPRQVRNVLFIMCDQLRADYLSCYGGAVPTPHLDRLAARGMRFDRAYVTSGVCGPSRTSFYTGRYPISHRVTWNRVPLPIDELSLGDYLAQEGRTLDLLGKTHFVPDRLARERRLRLDPQQQAMFDEGGFTPVERYDGHFEPAAGSGYRQYLLDQGYRSDQPWTDFVIGSDAADGSTASGWYLRNAALPARVSAKDSETAYLTSRAIDYIDQKGDAPWALHLSYIKPHWPFKAPAPYHGMFGPDDAPAPTRAAHERTHAHPVHAAYQQQEESLSFARDEVVRAIRPVYMGLVKQIDDEIGRLMAHLQALGRLDDTLIVFSSDHGDLAGDHWLGEKEYFYEPVMRIPLFVYDPDPRADATRGQVSQALVECIDVVPTILQALELPAHDHRVEGSSLLPLTRCQETPAWRQHVFGHLDYAYREARVFLGRTPHACNGFMASDGRHKLMLWQGYPSQVFDLQDDPGELHDRGADPALAQVRRRLENELLQWLANSRRRTTESSDQVLARTHAHERMMGILIGRW